MLISIVIPIFNEEDALPAFNQSLVELLESLPHDYEVWYVAGGSTDQTSQIVQRLHSANPRVKLLELSRNYGHQAALTAGLDFAKGDVVISMDGDGQHPPFVIPQLIAAYEAGNDVVLTQRRTTGEISYFQKLFSKTFYQLINKLSESEIVPDSADFRLLSREVVQDLRGLNEQHRFLRGMISWMGFQQTIVSFDAPPRLAGRSKFSLRKRLRLAADAIFSFSIVPINLVIAFGVLLLIAAVGQIFYVLLTLITVGNQGIPPGWTSLMLAVLIIGGTQMLTLGLIGYYVGMTFQESKRRPIYFVNRRLSTLDKTPPAVEAEQPNGSPSE
ncbi:MAG: glycosyltransferase family 2 protein [Chloroflexi bacterium]|nr:glycosyltransferase family 2 protein [Chloroflexota bacterium]MCC6895642.1 glycosyltransferase family 2 protein [Anaerolineae bacterium]